MTTISCPCGKTLRVPEGAAGKKLRCPECLTIHAVPVPISPTPEPEPEPVFEAEPVIDVQPISRVRNPKLPVGELIERGPAVPRLVEAEPPALEPPGEPVIKSRTKRGWIEKDDPDEKPAQPPIPPWAYVFAGLCGVIPVFTLGGALPMAIGFGGAGGCIGVARDDKKPVDLRVGLCLGITVLCWVLVIAIVGGLALLLNN